MPRSRERTQEEKEAISAARAKLREQDELAASEDREIERAIKAREIPDPDSNAEDFIEEDDDDDDFGAGEDGDDEDGDDASSSDADDEGGDDEEHEPGSGGDNDDADVAGSEEEGTGGSTRKRPGQGGENGKRNELASEWDERSRRQNLAGLDDPELAAEHLKVVGRPPHAKAERNTITSNIIKAERPKKG